jgi:hypothetical protein
LTLADGPLARQADRCRRANGAVGPAFYGKPQVRLPSADFQHFSRYFEYISAIAVGSKTTIDLFRWSKPFCIIINAVEACFTTLSIPNLLGLISHIEVINFAPCQSRPRTFFAVGKLISSSKIAPHLLED